MEINELLDLAKAKRGYKSDNQLSKAIGIAHTGLVRVRRGWGNLSENNMIALADLCEIPHDKALLLLNVWKSEGSVKDAYSSLLRRFAMVGLAFTIAASIVTPAQASTSFIYGNIADGIVSRTLGYCILW